MNSWKPFFLLIAVFIAFVLLGKLGTVAFASYSAPRLECITECDLGEHEIGEMVTQAFSIRNTGRTPLILGGIRSSCACTGLTRKVGENYERTNEVTVAPGAFENLFLRVRILNDKDASSQYVVSFVSNDPARPETIVKLNLRRARSALTLRPAHVDLGLLEPGETKQFVVEVEDDPKYQRQITSLRSNLPGWVKATFEPMPARDLNGQAKTVKLGRVRISVQPLAAEEVIGEIVLVTSLADSVPVRLGVSGRVRPWVDIYPRKLLLPRRSEEGWVHAAILTCRFASGVIGQIEVENCPAGVSIRPKSADGCIQWVVEADPSKWISVAESDLSFRWKLGTREGRESVRLHLNPAYREDSKPQR